MKSWKSDKTALSLLVQRLERDFSVLKGKTIVYVDYPLYTNVGDLLIYQGTIELFKRFGCYVESEYCLHNYSALLTRDIPDDWVIVLQGGGNFGDIYPKHQKLRTEVISTFVNNQIVMMPQSVYFDNPEEFKKNISAYLSHKRLKLHVRDNESYGFLREYLHKEQVFLSPDMALMLLGRWPWSSSAAGTLYLRRRDREIVGTHEVVHHSYDWDDIFSPLKRKMCWYIVKLARLEGKIQKQLGAGWIWSEYTQLILRDAYHLFEKYQTVDTDRLHGMIFSQLLGKYVVMGDNSYNKLARYKNAWPAVSQSQKSVP